MFFEINELLWLFFIYSFTGWVLETVIATFRQRTFVNRGLINGPFCIIYGVGALLISINLHELNGFWLFLFAAIYATVIEWIAGHLIEKIYHERWWNYTGIRWNLDGYICLPASAVWGVLGFLIIKWGNGLLLKLLLLFPSFLLQIILWILIGILIVDILASYILLKGKSTRLDQWEDANNRIANISVRLGRWITLRVNRRIHKAYPKAAKIEIAPKKDTVFAYGCDFYKVIMLFIIGAFLGDITETIFCRFAMGRWMSRSSLVWGPFSIVWGLAIAVVTAMLYKYKDRGDSFLFMTGALLGGAYEYLCSVATEILFGKIFWDYSHLPFNLGGRINLLFCFFWGIAAVVWFKLLYPKLSGLIERIPVKPGKIITWALILFMTVNIAVSGLALIRYDQRSRDVPAESSWQTWMDNYYDDTAMEHIYPSAKTIS